MTDHFRASDAAKAFVEDDPRPTPQFRSARELRMQYPELRTPLVEDLLREGETLNIIAAAKGNTSFLAPDLTISIATGSSFLGEFIITSPGAVLYIDNELHPETTADRLPKIAEARAVCAEKVDERVFIDNLRGRLVD